MSDDPFEYEQGNPSGSKPRGDGGKTPFQDTLDRYPRLKTLLAYLPTGATEEASDYNGILSYSVEWHAAVIGLAVGATAATTGNVQLVMGLISIALGLGRINQQASEKVKAQLVKEPWYGIFGAAIGYLAIGLSTGQLAEMIPV